MKDYESAFDYLADLSQREPQKEKTFNDFIDYLGPKGREKGIPLTGQFELTPLCNFDCRMCYTHLTREQMRGRASLSADQWKGLMREAWEAGMFRATLTGGECLTYPGFEELCLYLKNLGCVVDVMTNGELLDEKWIEFFKAHKPASIQITLYGGDEDTYERVTGRRAFGTVSDNIRRALDADLPIELCVTPSRYMGKAFSMRSGWPNPSPSAFRSILF